ncbi:MAG: DNA ligase [Erysipelotrichaceae bacterium]
MGKVNELSMLVDELKKCGETLIGISEGIADLFSGADKEKPPEKKTPPNKNPLEEPNLEQQEEKPLTLEEVRAVCADKSRKGFTAEVKAILTKHGADKLSEVDPAEYKALLAEVTRVGLTEVL